MLITIFVILYFAVFWGASLVAASYLAESKDRNAGTWVLLAIWLGWIAVLVLLCAPANKRRCPYCMEPIHREARICPFCRSTLPTLKQGSLPAIEWTDKNEVLYDHEWFFSTEAVQSMNSKRVNGEDAGPAWNVEELETFIDEHMRDHHDPYVAGGCWCGAVKVGSLAYS